MWKIQFKKHNITRNCTKKYRNCSRYKSFLKNDFKGHCAYCNLNDEWIAPMPFEVEHYIPKSVCKSSNRDDLETDYRNLMYACPMCNRLKGNKFEGDLSDITNLSFYNPVEIDYNTIFIGMKKEEFILMMN